MHKQIRWAVAGVILCGSAMAFGDEVKSPDGQKKEEVKKEKLTPKKREEAKALLADKAKEVKELRQKANEINKNIGELAISGKLTQEQEAIAQMKVWVDELSQVNDRLEKIEEEIAQILGWIEGQNEALPILSQGVSDLQKHKWGNYLQFQYLDDSRAGQSDSFRMRRARLGITETIDPKTSIKASFDLVATQFGTLNEPAESAVQLRDAFLIYDIEASDVAVGTQARMGRQPLPLGFELERSSSEREFPERAQYNQTLFPGERSTGITFTKGMGSNSLVQLGGYNALTYNDPQQRTSGAARGSKLGMLLGARTFGTNYDAGISFFKGERETISTTANNVTTTNPVMDREFLFLDGSYIGLLDPNLTLRGEMVMGQERLNSSGVISSTATADNMQRDVFGYQLQATYNLNYKNQLSVRYQGFDRDTDVDGNSITGWGLAYLYYINPGVRLTAAWEQFNDPLRSTERKYQTTTLRVQFRF